MRKFYQLIRIDLHMIEGEDQAKTLPMYMPIDPKKPELSLGYFSSKKKVLNHLVEICPKVMKNGTMTKPFYSGYNSRGRWEGWLLHDHFFTKAVLYMILEIEAE